MEALIVGSGTMGRWFAETLDAEVAFADLDETQAARAAAEMGGRSVSLETAERFPIVCIAVPMTAAIDAIADHASKATEAIVDLAGVMTGPVAAMAKYAPECERLSLHPLFAPENAPGRIAVVIDHSGSRTEEIRSWLQTAGNELFETTPRAHDRAMETVQARAHTAILAFGLAAEDVPEEFGTPIFEALWSLVDEVTNGTPRVYADIQATFSGAHDVASAAQQLAEADHDAFEQLYRQAGR